MPQFFDSNGDPLCFGVILTNVPSYFDEGHQFENGSTVKLDKYGCANIFFSKETSHVVIKDKKMNKILEWEI